MPRLATFMIAALLTCFAIGLRAQEAPAAAAPAEAAAADSTLKTKEQRLGYAIGMQIAQSLEQIRGNLDLEAMLAGLNDALNGKEPKLTQEQAQEVYQQFMMEQQVEQMKKMQEEATERATKAKEFFAANKDKEGVKVTESGIQYLVVKEGEGAKPAATDAVKVNLQASLLGGEEIVDTEANGEPMVFPLGELPIPGLVEAARMLSKGAKYTFWIPESQLAEEGGRPSFPPGSTLVATMELVEFGAPDKLMPQMPQPPAPPAPDAPPAPPAPAN